MISMKQIFIIGLLLITMNGRSQDFFPQEDLMSIGIYYYPEHWNPSQWERDIQNISNHGFKFIHVAEFSWAMLEPSEGVYDFKWLDKVVELASKYKLKVLMCTPSPCPPVWMGIKYPDIYLMDAIYQREEHGTRANMSLTNLNVLRLSKKIVNEMAKHYGQNKNIMGWQLDNEPEAKEDYSPSAQKAFKFWLKNKYQTVKNLNTAWGTAFWSQVYSGFEQVKIPNATSVGWWGCNPTALLDYKRFSSDIQAKFLDMQAEELKKYIDKKQFITTNYVAKGTQADPSKTEMLNFASFTSYPNYGSDNLGDLGFRLGDYNVLMFANDYYRSLKGQFGVMELQPGQVNWGGYNPLLLPGTVRMWFYHCFGGGCSFACSYRYRQILYGAEQFHSGIINTDGVSLSPGGKEYVQVIKEMEALKKGFDPSAKMPVAIEKRKMAILWSFDNFWNLERQKQSYNWDTWGNLHKFHRILKSLGAPVDFIGENDDFSQYKFLLVPAYEMVDSALVKKWKEYVNNGGNLIISCRTGSKDKNAWFWESNISGIMNDLIGGKINSIDMLSASKHGQIEMNGQTYSWNSWGELIEPNSNDNILAKYADQFYKGTVCCLKNKIGPGSVWYIGVDSNNGGIEKDILKQVYSSNQVTTEDYPEGVLVYWRDGFMVAVNYSSLNYQLKTRANAKFLIGDAELGPADVAVWVEN
jgi:beta-galactosidase